MSAVEDLIDRDEGPEDLIDRDEDLIIAGGYEVQEYVAEDAPEGPKEATFPNEPKVANAVGSKSIDDHEVVSQPPAGKVQWLPTFLALVRKNFLLFKSAKLQILIAFLMPAIGISLVRSFQALVENKIDDWLILTSDKTIYTEPSIPVAHCQWMDVYATEATGDCVTILYAPFANASNEDLDIINRLMSEVADEAGLSFGVSSDIPDNFLDAPDIFGVPSAETMAEFLTSHYGRASATVYFRSPIAEEGSQASTLIDVRANGTIFGSYNWDERPAVVIPSAIRRALLATRGSIKVDIQARGFDGADQTTKPPTSEEADDTDEDEEQEWIDVLVALFILIILTFTHVVTAALLGNFPASEKQQGLIGSLRVNGMADSAYWCSWFTAQLVVQFFGTLFAVILAHFMKMAVITDAGFLSPFLALFFNGVLMYSLILLAVSLAPNRIVLYGLQFLVFAIGLTSAIMSLILNASPEDKAGKIFQASIPGYNFAKIVMNIANYNNRGITYSGDANVSISEYTTSTMFDQIGDCRWELIGENNETAICNMQEKVDYFKCWDYYDCDPVERDCPEHCFYYPITDFASLLIMLAQTAVLMFLSWYFLQVLPSGNGLCQAPWFIFDPKYWLTGSPSNGGDDQKQSLHEQSVITKALTKSFGPNTAVNSLDLQISNGQVYVLLGHNGAGKTTLINILSGKMAPTSGEAYLLGYSVNEDLHEIQRLVGSVPQHDLLWGELSAAEHIRMFAQMKGIAKSPAELEEKVNAILKKVHLEAAANQAAGGYSGGMKRRLSIALAGIGGPKIIFMDEPTTGIDPLNRRRIWNLVRELKKDRIIVLTTHLMQEADILGDYVTILDDGNVQAAGTPLNLKTEHGTGYTLTLVADVKNVDQVKKLVTMKIPSLSVVNEAAGSLALGIPKDSVDRVPDVTRQLQDESLIREWSIAQSTLEEVFLRLANQSSNLQNRNQQMASQQQETNTSNAGTADEIDEEEGGATGPVGETVFITGLPLWSLQIAVLLRKSAIMSMRAWIGTLIQFALPVGIIFLLWYGEWKTGNEIDNEYEIEVFPGGTADRYDIDRYNGIDSWGYYHDPCNFEWRLLADLDNKLDQLLTVQGAANSIKYPSAYDGASGMQFDVTVAAGVDPETVKDALIQGMEFFLSLTTSSDTQELADAKCSEFFVNFDSSFAKCGPCSLSYTGTWNATRVSSDQIHFQVTDLSGYFYLQTACTVSTETCGLREIDYLLDQPEVVSFASNVLGTEMTIESKWQIARSTSQEPNTLTRVGIEYSSRYNSNGGFDYYNYGSQCSLCYGHESVIWISGENADVFRDALNASTRILAIAIDEEVEEVVLRNRLELETEVTSFSTSSGAFDFSACATIEGYPEWYYIDNRYVEEFGLETEGVIVNSLNPTPYDALFDDFSTMYDSSICGDMDGPVAAYYEKFPDAGISLSSRTDESGITTIGVTWLFAEQSRDEGSYDLNRQAVYSVHCHSSDVDANGECIPGSHLLCARALSQESCQSYDYKDYDDFAEKTYSYLSSIIGGVPVFREIYNGISVTFFAAVSLQDIGLLSFVICFVLLPIIPTLTSSLVSEKHQRHVYSLVLNGMNLGAYWISQYICNAALTLVIEIIIVVAARSFGLKVFKENDIDFGLVFVLFLTYIHAQFGFVVLLSNLFKRERFAAVVVGILAIAMAGTGILTHMATDGTTSMNEWGWYWALFPTIGLFRGLVLVFWARHYSEVWRIVAIMLLSSSLYLAIGIYWHGATGDGALFKSCFTGVGGSESDNFELDASKDDDGAEADIVQEEERALKVSPSDAAVKIVHLGKTFPTRPEPKHAVVDLSLAMNYGEIFGLLGPNGCGKTTTISMLVGLLNPSRGKAFVGGFDTVLERKDAIRKLGIVPQFDVLYPELTVKEHLMMFAGCKGVAWSEQEEWATRIAKSVGLGDALFNRHSRALSGGMKRRLSIAIALLSDPRVLFLDEPTTGLDPDVKRAIWNIVERMRSERCVILTTHAMDEAEALCSRIGIMAQGAMKCIGTQSDLRARYGKTYELTFTVSDDDQDLEGYLRKHCSSTKQVSCYGQTHVYTVEKEEIELADLFDLVIKGQKQGVFSEWGLNNTSLDEVFIAITAESEGVDASEL